MYLIPILWWGNEVGGGGVICSSIDGSAGIPWAVANAERVISSVAILGYRYSGYSLADMRIHDINLVCDLNEHDPNAPTVPPPTQDPDPDGQQATQISDGTAGGSIDGSLYIMGAYIDDLLTTITSEISAWWTGWWPTLHIQISKTLTADITISILISVDILGNLQLETIDYTICGYESLSEGDAEAAAKEVVGSSAWALDASVVLSGAAMQLAWFVVGKLSTIATPMTENVFWFALGIAMATTFAYYALLLWKISQSPVPLWVRAIGFFVPALVMLYGGFDNYGTAEALVDNCYFTSKVSDYFGELWSYDFMRDRYQNVQVRTHTGLAIAQVICAVTAFAISAGLLMGWI